MQVIQTKFRPEAEYPYQTVNMEAICSVLPGESPFGPDDFRYSQLHDEIRDARVSEDPALVEEGEPKKANWGVVAKLCRQALEHQTKELVVAFWLLEAWIYDFGAIGLADGARVLAEFLPAMLEGAKEKQAASYIEVQAASLVWMNDKLPHIIRNLSIIEKRLDDTPLYTVQDCIALRDPAKKTEAPPAGAGEAKKEWTKDALLRAAERNSIAYNDMMLGVSHMALAMAQQLDEYLGAFPAEEVHIEPMDVFRFKKSIEDLVEAVEFVDKARPRVAELADATEFSEMDLEAGEEGAVVGTDEAGSQAISLSGKFKNRSQVYALLRTALDDLQVREPHSPVVLLLKCILDWEHKNLHEILAAFTARGKTLEDLYMLLEPLAAPGSGASGGAGMGGMGDPYGGQGGGFPPQQGGGGYAPDMGGGGFGGPPGGGFGGPPGGDFGGQPPGGGWSPGGGF